MRASERRLWDEQDRVDSMVNRMLQDHNWLDAFPGGTGSLDIDTEPAHQTEPPECSLSPRNAPREETVRDEAVKRCETTLSDEWEMESNLF